MSAIFTYTLQILAYGLVFSAPSILMYLALTRLAKSSRSQIVFSVCPHCGGLAQKVYSSVTETKRHAKKLPSSPTLHLVRK